MGYLPTFILDLIDVIEDTGYWEASCGDMEAIHCPLVHKIISSTTVKECAFGHFVFVKKEVDINAVLSVANIHSTYL